MRFGRGAKFILITAAFVVVSAGIKLAAPLLVPFLLALFIAAASSPVMAYMVRIRVPRVLGVTLTVLIDMALFTLVALLFVGSLNQLSDAMPIYQHKVFALWDELLLWLAAHGLHAPADTLQELIKPGWWLDITATTIRSFATFFSVSFLVTLLVVFILLEATGFGIKVRELSDEPETKMAQISRALREVQKYLTVKAAMSAITGILAGLWVYACGVDFPLLWGILAFVLNYIPTLGSIIAALPPVFLALVQYNFATAFAVGTGYLAINGTIGSFTEPRILGRALGLSPLVVLLSVVFWGFLLGPVGAVLSVPLTMVVKVASVNIDDLQWLAVVLAPATKRGVPRLTVRPEKDIPGAGSGR